MQSNLLVTPLIVEPTLRISPLWLSLLRENMTSETLTLEPLLPIAVFGMPPTSLNGTLPMTTLVVGS